MTLESGMALKDVLWLDECTLNSGTELSWFSSASGGKTILVCKTQSLFRIITSM